MQILFLLDFASNKGQLNGRSWKYLVKRIFEEHYIIWSLVSAHLIYRKSVLPWSPINRLYIVQILPFITSSLTTVLQPQSQSDGWRVENVTSRDTDDKVGGRRISLSSTYFPTSREEEILSDSGSGYVNNSVVSYEVPRSVLEEVRFLYHFQVLATFVTHSVNWYCNFNITQCNIAEW